MQKYLILSGIPVFVHSSSNPCRRSASTGVNKRRRPVPGSETTCVERLSVDSLVNIVRPGLSQGSGNAIGPSEKVYSCPFVNPIEGKRPGIIIDPRIEGWTTNNHEGGNATAEVWYNDTLLSIAEDEYYIGDNKDEMLAVHLWGPNAGFSDNVYIVFKVNGKAKKLIVVTPPTK